MINVLNYITLQDAWEGINTALARGDEEITRGGGGMYGTEFIAYNTMIAVNKAWIDPDFDFGRVLGYTIKKWTTLVKNYVDFDYLDLVKSEITTRRGKNAKSYNYAYHFANKYGGGKDCLLSLVFSQRIGEDYPTVFFNVRVSEVTSRLNFDFLLVQRICEYVYGEGHPVEVHFFAPSMFITAERFSMFAHHMGWDEFEETLGEGKFQDRIRKIYEHFATADLKTITYKSHQRCAEVIQGHGHKVNSSLFAKDLKLTNMVEELPHDVITLSQHRKHRTKKKKHESSK